MLPIRIDMKPFAFQGLRLQAKILLLSLVPLMVAVLALTTWSALERARATDHSLAQQRQAMIAMRERGIRSAAELRVCQVSNRRLAAALGNVPHVVLRLLITPSIPI